MNKLNAQGLRIGEGQPALKPLSGEVQGVKSNEGTVQTHRLERSYRATVMDAVLDANTWCTSHDLVKKTQLTYPQVLFALHALHSAEKIARMGRKFTAKWGALTLVRESEHNYDLLEKLFNDFAKR